MRAAIICTKKFPPGTVAYISIDKKEWKHCIVLNEFEVAIKRENFHGYYIKDLEKIPFRLRKIQSAKELLEDTLAPIFEELLFKTTYPELSKILLVKLYDAGIRATNNPEDYTGEIK